MSFGKKNQNQSSNEVQTAQLDPLAREALTDVLDQSRALFGSNAPIFAPTDPSTFAGLNALEGRGLSPFIPIASDQLSQTLGGDFFNPSRSERAALNQALSGGPASIEAVQDQIFNAARQAVGDQFTGTGRTGSPAEFNTLGRTVSRELAPFVFDSLNNERNLQVQGRLQALGLSDAAFARERGNQLAAFGAIPGLDQALDSAANRRLAVGDIRRTEAQRELDTPFTRFERFANPLIAAAGGFPVTLTREGTSRGSQTSFGFNLF